MHFLPCSHARELNHKPLTVSTSTVCYIIPNRMKVWSLPWSAIYFEGGEKKNKKRLSPK